MQARHGAVRITHEKRFEVVEVIMLKWSMDKARSEFGMMGVIEVLRKIQERMLQ